MKPTNSFINQSVNKNNQTYKSKYKSKNLTKINQNNSILENFNKNSSPKITAKLITSESPNVFEDSDDKFKQLISKKNLS